MVNLFRRIRHWLAHLLGWNSGRVVSFQEGDKIMVGFKCDYCDKIEATTDITSFQYNLKKDIND